MWEGMTALRLVCLRRFINKDKLEVFAVFKMCWRRRVRKELSPSDGDGVRVWGLKEVQFSEMDNSL